MVTGEAPGSAAAEGRLIGDRYRLDEPLGSGGMGTVWAGHDLLVHREVAVKEARTARDPARVERVLREARAAARVNHPSVVTVHDVVMEDGHPWIVMERVRGESLADRLDRDGALPEREAARIALHLAEALTAAHDRGVLHRDVKPANVLLADDGRVVLTDFGIAYIAGEESLTRSGEFIGSLAYTAPERMGGRRPAPASDLWSLGVLVYEMTEGRSPFRRDSMEGTVAAVLTDAPPPPRRADALAPVVLALLAKDPEERPTADAVTARLRAVTEPPPEAEEKRQPPPVRRKTWAAVAAAAVLVSLGAWAVTHWADRPDRDGASGPATPTSTASPSSSPSSAPGYVQVREPGFRAEVPAGWTAHPRNAQGQYRYTQGAFEIVIVPGRDLASRFSADPLAYQRDHEPELRPWRDSSWSYASGMTLTRIAGASSAIGTFNWADDGDHERLAANAALLIGGRYHLVIVLGPVDRGEAIEQYHAHVRASYEAAGG
ncbi:serine/threonine-protein kinase [Streptomyces fradiae]|uniref:serine/threonine-protein kinase n=1 Tax=Streptomyces fradiae TaxID=1906 RepID=UPI003511C76D